MKSKDPQYNRRNDGLRVQLEKAYDFDQRWQNYDEFTMRLLEQINQLFSERTDPVISIIDQLIDLLKYSISICFALIAALAGFKNVQFNDSRIGAVFIFVIIASFFMVLAFYLRTARAKKYYSILVSQKEIMTNLQNSLTRRIEVLNMISELNNSELKVELKK